LGRHLDDISKERNFLRLHSSIEHAFDRKQLYFKYHGEDATTISLKVQVMDPDFFSLSIFDNNRKQICLFGDIHDRTITFCLKNKPFMRLLALHGLRTLSHARTKRWINDDTVEMEQDHERAREMARMSLEATHVGVGGVKCASNPIMQAFFSTSSVYV
jgi:hypothetical protein